MPITSTPPPVRGTPGRPAPKAKPNLRTQREEAVAGFGQLAQAPLIALKLYADAGAVGIYWPKISEEIATLADSQEQVARLIDPLIRIGPYTGLITAILPMILQIGVNHGRVPAGAMGTVPAASLTARVEASLAAIELEALRAQAEAEKAAAEMRDQISKSRTSLAETQQAA
jgi:hypothetical protein